MRIVWRLVLLLYVVACGSLFYALSTVQDSFPTEWKFADGSQIPLRIPVTTMLLGTYDTTNFAPSQAFVCGYWGTSTKELKRFCAVSNEQLQAAARRYGEAQAPDTLFGATMPRQNLLRARLGLAIGVMMLGLLALIVLGWIVRVIWRSASAPVLSVSTADSSPPDVSVGFFQFTGTVQDDVKVWSETHVSGGGGNFENVKPISSYVTRHQRYFLRAEDGRERDFEIDPSHFPVRPGHVVTAVYATTPQRQDFGWVALSYNHALGRSHINWESIYRARGRIITLNVILVIGILALGASYAAQQNSGVPLLVSVVAAFVVPILVKVSKHPGDRRIARAANAYLQATLAAQAASPSAAAVPPEAHSRRA